MEEIVWVDEVNNAKLYKENKKLYLHIAQDGYTADLPIKSKDDFHRYYKIWGFKEPKQHSKLINQSKLF